jgi:hypothetical protein
MSSQQNDQQRGLVEVFLGPEAALGGPFALLDLKHDPLDESMVLRACQSRLRAVALHPQSRTPGADEVRLAVHAAASQLLDHDLRRELAKQWPSGSGDILNHQPLPEAWRVDDAVELDHQVLKEANWLIGASGGWNSKSRKRLGFFARVHQVPAAQLISAIVGDDPGDSLNDARSDQKRFSLTPLNVTSIESMPWFLFPVLYALFAITLVSVGVVHSANQLTNNDALGVDHSENSRPQVLEIPIQTISTVDRVPSERRHFSAVIHELSLANSEVILDADQAVAFSELCKRFCDQWTKIPADDLVATVEIIRNSLSNILNKDHFELACMFLETDTNLSLEPMLIPAIRAWVFGDQTQMPQFGEIVSSIENDFLYELSRVQNRVTSQSVDDPAWWHWLDEQLGAESIGIDTRQRGWLSAGRSGLLIGPANEKWKDCTRIFVQRIEWDEGSDARVWYLSQVSDREVPSDRLAVLSRSLALYSSAQGLDLETLVAVDASMEQREAYLNTIRSRWGKQDLVVDEDRERLVNQAQTLLRLTEGKMGDAQVLNRGIELARLNSACWARSRDDQASVQLMIQRFNSPVNHSSQTQLRPDLSSDQIDERWADDARNSSDTNQLLDLLQELDRLDDIGPKSAHALVLLAMQAPDLGVRDAAERTLLSHRDEVTVLIALDRVAGSERVSRRMMELIRSCIDEDNGVGDAYSLRRSLLESLVKNGVFGSDNSAANAGSFVDEYLKLLGVRIGSQGGTTTRDLYQKLIRNIFEQGEEIPRSVVAELRVGKVMAVGPIQADTVYMRGVLRLFALQIKNESPGTVTQVESVIRDFETRMGGADRALEQIMLIERAIAELWLIKLESELIS